MNIFNNNANVSRKISGSLALMMESLSIFETSVNFYKTTRKKIPEDIFHLEVYVTKVNLSEIAYFSFMEKFYCITNSMEPSRQLEAVKFCPVSFHLKISHV